MQFWRNHSDRYSVISGWLHWITAACMVPTLFIAIYMDSLREDVPGDPLKYFAVLPWHKTLGFLVLCIVVIRLPLAVFNRSPVLPDSMTTWQKSLAHMTHYSLYGLMLVLPLLGWLSTSAGQTTFKLFTLWKMPYLTDNKDQNLADFANEVHVGLGWAVIVLLAVHVGAALWHQYYLKDGLMQRMTIGRRNRPSKPSARDVG